jgi:DUF4097 and DUF4098 domain-containing protein YvlB
MIRRALLVTLFVASGAAAASDEDYDKVNGSIEVAAGRKVDQDVSTVNGSITIAEGASVKDAETVNGSITLGQRATANKLSTVNGRLTLDSGANVTGAIGNINGDIRLSGAHVAGGIRTINGNIDIGANSRVEGGILVEKPSMSWFSWKGKPPRVVIGPGAVVQGTLKFEREVVLYVSDRATIGPVVGATPVKFSGETPSP